MAEGCDHLVWNFESLVSNGTFHANREENCIVIYQYLIGPEGILEDSNIKDRGLN